MTLNELINKLQALEPDYGECRVIVRGYEGGQDDVDTVAPVIVHIDGNVYGLDKQGRKDSGYSGHHKVVDPDDIRYDQEWGDNAPGYDAYAHAIFIKHGEL